ncbi:MAG: ATPase domain-containing protein [Acidobacteriaceae bacterium]
MSVVAEPERIPTGIPGLDEILLGGLTVGQTYLIEGQPGTGKTTASLQFLLEGKRRGERCLFISLSESKADLELAARSHGWSLEGVSILEFVPQEASLEDAEQYSVFHPGEVELAGTIKKLVAEVERINPQRLVIDSLVEFRLLAREPVHYRRQVLALKHFFSGRHITVLMLDDPASATSSDLQVESMVHGVIRISVLQRSYGSRRRHAEVIKVRSSAFREGFHDYTIRRGGIEIYPRLVAAEHGDDFPPQQVSSGLSALDAMFGGGIERGSSTLILGPSGVGKSSLTMLYAHAAAERAERTVVYTFDETLRTSRLRARPRNSRQCGRKSASIHGAGRSGGALARGIHRPHPARGRAEPDARYRHRQPQWLQTFYARRA